MLCSTLPTKSQNELNNGGLGGIIGCADWWTTNIGIGTGDATINNVNGFKAWWEVNGGDIVYEINAPVTYQLTNQQVIQLLKGSNNIWADTGNVALEYPADTKLYIDGKVAELQALILENISNS